MLTTNDESLLLDMFRDLETNEIVVFGDEAKCDFIFNSIKSDKWINSSDKNAPPPDFYNPQGKLMLEVMRIDDHAYVDNKNKIQNKTLQHESELYKKHFSDLDNTDMRLFISANTRLSTNDDHNFTRYYDSFKRVFNSHANKLKLYKENHPGYKIIFFIFDESSAYVEATKKADVIKDKKIGDEILSKPHLQFFDKKFVGVLKDTKVDFVVWYAPYKLTETKNSDILNLPLAAIYDVANINTKNVIEYNHDMMISTEV